jgi:hypothetical protein
MGKRNTYFLGINMIKISFKKLWRIWSKALGEKAGSTDSEADKVAIVRSLIVAWYLITNLFIILNVLRHW